MKYKFTNIITVSIAVFLIFGLILTFYPFLGVEKVIKDAFLKRDSDLDSLVAKTFYEKNPEHKLVVSEFNLSKPTYSLVYFYSKSSESEKGVYKIMVFDLERERLFNFRVNQIRSADTRNLTLNEIVEHAKKGDISKDNPDPENITVYIPPTPEEIESTKKSQEITNDPAYQAEKEKCREDARPTLDEAKARQCIRALDKKYGKE